MENLSELSLKLVLVLIPGILATLLYEKLAVYGKRSNLYFFFSALLFSCISYLIAQQIYIWCSIENDHLLHFWDSIQFESIPFRAILPASIIAIVISIITSALENHKVIMNLAKWLRITSKYGDENLFYYFLNGKKTEEVYVRDTENNLTYHGLVDSFSEDDSIQEILLYNVAVYSTDDSEKIDELQRVYICKQKGILTIELPAYGEETE